MLNLKNFCNEIEMFFKSSKFVKNQIKIKNFLKIPDPTQTYAPFFVKITSFVPNYNFTIFLIEFHFAALNSSLRGNFYTFRLLTWLNGPRLAFFPSPSAIVQAFRPFVQGISNGLDFGCSEDLKHI